MRLVKGLLVLGTSLVLAASFISTARADGEEMPIDPMPPEVSVQDGNGAMSAASVYSKVEESSDDQTVTMETSADAASMSMSSFGDNVGSNATAGFNDEGASASAGASTTMPVSE
jgi:hypothetical protein